MFVSIGFWPATRGADMLENLYRWPRLRAQHTQAPLLREREQYLTHLLALGLSRGRVRTVAAMLLHIIRLLGLNQTRVVEIDEIKRAGARWAIDIEHHITRKPGPGSEEHFVFVALKWLRFSNLIPRPEVHPRPSEVIVEEFAQYLRESGYSAQTIRSYSSRVFNFAEWLLLKREQLSMVSIRDVEEFLNMKRGEGLMPRTMGSFCSALTAYFRYTEPRGLTIPGIYRTIHRPRIIRVSPLRRLVPWKLVRQLLKTRDVANPAELRATAMLSLCAIYGMRSCEVVNLTLDDFDWVNETFIVKRAKHGRVQQYPIQFEVGDAILQYLQRGRTRASCRNVFLTLKPPYRPVKPSTLWTVIAERMQRLGIEATPFGPHALRHACATELLRKGSSLQDIADLLGHRGLQSVSIYAKQDARLLKQVADFRLLGVI
jgi:integrase/recombinase XerD